jgi:hypothetical protein
VQRRTYSSLLELVPLPSRFSGLWYFGRERSPRGFQSSQDCGDAPRASAHHHPPVVVIASSTTTPKCRLRLKRRWSTNRPKRRRQPPSPTGQHTRGLWGSNTNRAKYPPRPPSMTTSSSSSPHGTIQTGCPAPTTSGKALLTTFDIL